MTLTNNEYTHFSQDVFRRQYHSPSVQQPLDGVRQDNPATPRERTASPQPVTVRKDARTQPQNNKTVRSQKRSKSKRKTVPGMFWLKPVVKAELERIADQEGLSFSATGAAFLEKAVQQDIHTQRGALLDTIIEKAIGKHMRSYSARLAVLLVRGIFASEQTRSIATNILGRQPGVSQPVLENILNGSSNAAKRNITRITPQLADLLKEVEKWMQEAETYV